MGYNRKLMGYLASLWAITTIYLQSHITYGLYSKFYGLSIRFMDLEKFIAKALDKGFD